jgi:hypothetical protein
VTAQERSGSLTTTIPALAALVSSLCLLNHTRRKSWSLSRFDHFRREIIINPAEDMCLGSEVTLSLHQLSKGQLLSSGGFVYIFCWVADGVEIPFYVGETNRFSGRMNDYDLANFKASMDFCVGEAVKYLKGTQNYRVVVRHRPSPDSPKEEKAIIRRLLVSGVWLLNCLPRYDYRSDSDTEEREVVQKFCDMFTGRLPV